MLLGPDARHVDDGGTLARCRAPERGASADVKCLMPVPADNRVMDRCARRRREAESRHVDLDLDIASGVESFATACWAIHEECATSRNLIIQFESNVLFVRVNLSCRDQLVLPLCYGYPTLRAAARPMFRPGK